MQIHKIPERKFDQMTEPTMKYIQEHLKKGKTIEKLFENIGTLNARYSNAMMDLEERLKPLSEKPGTEKEINKIMKEAAYVDKVYKDELSRIVDDCTTEEKTPTKFIISGGIGMVAAYFGLDSIMKKTGYTVAKKEVARYIGQESLRPTVFHGKYITELIGPGGEVTNTSSRYIRQIIVEAERVKGAKGVYNLKPYIFRGAAENGAKQIGVELGAKGAGKAVKSAGVGWWYSAHVPERALEGYGKAYTAGLKRALKGTLRMGPKLAKGIIIDAAIAFGVGCTSHLTYTYLADEIVEKQVLNLLKIERVTPGLKKKE